MSSPPRKSAFDDIPEMPEGMVVDKEGHEIDYEYDEGGFDPKYD